jgi:hypothetical protein
MKFATSGVVALPAQVPEAGPDTPPPSNKLVDIPESEELPGIEVPMPEDVCESEPPTPAQVAMPPIAGNVPDIVGLTPGDASSVAPIGIPDGPTGEPGPRPSGDVRPSGWPGEMLIPPTCAEAEPQPKRTAAAAATAKRVIIRSTLLDPGLGHARQLLSSNGPATPMRGSSLRVRHRPDRGRDAAG